MKRSTIQPHSKGNFTYRMDFSREVVTEEYRLIESFFVYVELHTNDRTVRTLLQGAASREQRG